MCAFFLDNLKADLQDADFSLPQVECILQSPESTKFTSVINFLLSGLVKGDGLIALKRMCNWDPVQLAYGFKHEVYEKLKFTLDIEDSSSQEIFEYEFLVLWEKLQLYFHDPDFPKMIELQFCFERIEALHGEVNKLLPSCTHLVLLCRVATLLYIQSVAKISGAEKYVKMYREKSSKLIEDLLLILNGVRDFNEKRIGVVVPAEWHAIHRGRVVRNIDILPPEIGTWVGGFEFDGRMVKYAAEGESDANSKIVYEHSLKKSELVRDVDFHFGQPVNVIKSFVEMSMSWKP